MITTVWLSVMLYVTFQFQLQLVVTVSVILLLQLNFTVSKRTLLHSGAAPRF